MPACQEGGKAGRKGREQEGRRSGPKGARAASRVYFFLLDLASRHWSPQMPPGRLAKLQQIGLDWIGAQNYVMMDPNPAGVQHKEEVTERGK